MSEFNEIKYEKLVDYLISCTDHDIDVVHIQNLLYLFDFDYYELYETYLTGESYRKSVTGVVSGHLETILENVLDEHGRFQSTSYTDLSVFSKRDIEFIDRTLSRYKSYFPNDVLEYVLHDLPCEVTDHDNMIDYELVFYRDQSTSRRNYQAD
jgi:hypothetical protein